MTYDQPLIKATLIKRYKRFLADVLLPDGTAVTAHCPNSGSMKGYNDEGLAVWLLPSDNPKRKLNYTWELVEDRDGDRIMVHAARANALVKEAIENGIVKELQGYETLRSEVRYGSQNSRIDLLLEKDGDRCYIEVKSVTLKEDGVLMFPDAVTTRGQKHLQELMEVKRNGDRAVLFFAVLREGGSDFRPAAHIDPLYAALLHDAINAGVEVLLYRAGFEGDTVGLSPMQGESGEQTKRTGR